MDKLQRSIAEAIVGSPDRPFTSKELGLALGLSAVSIRTRGKIPELISMGIVKSPKRGVYQSAI